MDQFALPVQDVYQLLKAKQIQYLYHANTLSTALTFIQNDALLSRHAVDANNLFQSPQDSDAEDKLYKVWDHVFFDGFDLHNKYHRANKYGPVLFRFNLRMLQSPKIQHFFITKSNPWYWKGTSEDQRFYSSIDELSEQYLTGKRLDSQVMFTLRSPGFSINLSAYLDSIIVDNPLTKVNSPSLGKISAGTYLKKVIENELVKKNLAHIPVFFRQHTTRWCMCWLEYQYMIIAGNSAFKRRFGK